MASAFWLLYSLLFSLYLDTFSYDKTYGALAGVIILTFYLHYSAVILLVGAEVNQVIEWHIPGGKNEGDKAPKDARRPKARRLRR